MMRRPVVLWALSAVMLLWLLAMSAANYRISRCQELGGQWSWKGWKCRLLPPIELQRDIRRS
jgi:hypothetical protein